MTGFIFRKKIETRCQYSAAKLTLRKFYLNLITDRLSICHLLACRAKGVGIILFPIFHEHAQHDGLVL